MEKCRTFSGGDPLYDRIFCGKCVAESDMENGVEAENPGFFLSDPQLCRKRYFRWSLFPGGAATKRRFFSSVVFMRIYNIRSAFDGCIYAVFGNGDRNDPGIISSGIRYLWQCGRSRTSDATVSDLYSGVFLSCRYCIQTIVWDLEKLWACAAEIRGLFSAGDHSFSAVYRGNPCRKFFEPLYRRKSYKGPENFLRKISTISSNGFHKICDIWWFVPESVEIVRFYDEKLFDFM